MNKVLGLVLGAVALFGGMTQAQQVPTLELFYGAECPHCHEEMEWLEVVREGYPDLVVEKYEVWHDATNRKLWQSRMAELDEKAQGVPTNIIGGDTVVVGFERGKIQRILEEKYGIPSDANCSCTGEIENCSCGCDQHEEICSVPTWERFLKFPWPVMSLVLGLVDGFNPCAMWSLFILLGFLLGMEDKKRRWLIGGVFIASSGILYFGALLTYLLGFSEISAMVAGSAMSWVFRAVGTLAVVTGARVIWAARRAQIECSVRDAGSRAKFSKKMHKILGKKNVWLVLVGVTGLAFSVNAVELLCSFAIPTTFTATLVSLKLPFWQQLVALGLYDLMYILDDLLVFVIAMWTLSLKIFSPKLVQWSHAVGGVLLLLIGAALLLDPQFLTQILG